MILKMKYFLSVAAAFVAMAPFTHSQNLSDLPAWKISPPEKPAVDVYVEGEAFDQQEGGSVNADPACYGGKAWVLYGMKGGKVSYKLRVSKKGNYLVAVACQEFGVAWTSPVSYSIDGEPIRNAVKGPASANAWGNSKANRWIFLTLTALEEGEHTLSFAATQHRAMDDKFAFAVDAVALVYEPFSKLDLPLRLAPDAKVGVFTAPKALTFSPATRGLPKGASYRVTDFFENETAKGEWNGEGSLGLPELPFGYYLLHVKEKGSVNETQVIPFVRLPDPEKRKTHPDAPYAVDTAQSWLSVPGKHPLFPGDTFTLTSDLVKWAGIGKVRDRFSFSQVNPASNQYVFDNVYLKNAKLLRERGIQVTSVYHNAPEWTKGKLKSLPQDLFALYRFCRDFSKEYQNEVEAWEFWNEENISFCLDSSWDFAAAQKVAFLGYRAGNPQAKVLIGSLATDPLAVPPRYFEGIFENGVAGYFDAYNFHIYRPVGEHPVMFSNTRAFLKRYGSEAPLWITENGTADEGMGKLPALVTNREEREHDVAQEKSQAEYLVKSMVLADANGAARNYYFVFPPYNEKGGGKVWGIFRFDFTPKPAYAAFSELTAQLSQMKCLGRGNAGEGIEAFLYEPREGSSEKKQLVVLWSRKGDELPISISAGEAFDIMGKPLSGSVKADRYPKYLRGLSGLKVSETVTVDPKAKTDVSPVVLRVRLGESFVNYNKSLSMVSGSKPELSLDVFNFSDSPKKVALKNFGSGYTVEGLSDLSVPAMGMSTLTIRLTLQSADVQAIRFGGEAAGKSLAEVNVAVVRDLSKDEGIAARPLAYEDAALWRMNAAGPMTAEYDESEKAVRFEVKFPANVDRWIYPELSVQDARLGADVKGISFEIKAKEVGAKGVAYSYLMAVLEDVKETGRSINFGYPAPKTGWQTVTINFSAEAPKGFSPEMVKRLRIGCNPNQDNFTYWVRNVKVFERKK